MNFLTSDQKSGQRHGLVFRCPICPWKDALYFPLLTSGKTNGDPACDASVPMPTPSCLQEISQETKAGMEEEGFNKRWVRFQLLWGHLAGLRRYLPTGLSCLLEDLGKQPVAPGPPCLSKELYRKEQYCSTGRTGGSRERGCGQTITRLLSFLGKKPPEHYCPDWSENQGLWVGSSQWCLRLPEHPDESCCCQKGPGAASCSSACYGSLSLSFFLWTGVPSTSNCPLTELQQRLWLVRVLIRAQAQAGGESPLTGCCILSCFPCGS